VTESLVTFVVPTIGRTTLVSTIASLQAQTDPGWRALIVADGPHLIPLRGRDERITLLHAPHHRSAGLTRNFALPFVRTPWTAFVDDDDELAPEYVEHLRELDGNDVVVFRMDDPVLGILPAPEEPQIEWGKVGISYAVRTRWFAEVGVCFAREQLNGRFGAEGLNEDIQLLRLLQRLDAQLTIADYVGYLVRSSMRSSLL
jgi:glycosyltransferase involved in cell wall biosynthesis